MGRGNASNKFLQRTVSPELATLLKSFEIVSDWGINNISPSQRIKVMKEYAVELYQTMIETYNELNPED